MEETIDLLPTVVLQHHKRDETLVVNRQDYLAGKSTRFAQWRLKGQEDFVDPPKTRAELSDNAERDTTSVGETGLAANKGKDRPSPPQDHRGKHHRGKSKKSGRWS